MHFYFSESLKSSLFDGSVSTDTDSEESTARILPPGTPGMALIDSESLKTATFQVNKWVGKVLRKSES